MKVILLTKERHAIVDEEDFESLSKYSWFFNDKNGYTAKNNPKCDGIRKKEYMHRFIMNAPKGMEVDHINGDKLDNRKCNLRICTRSENNGNMRKTRGISKYKGVVWHKTDKKWQAQLSKKYIGYFNSEIEAALAYNEDAKKYFGEFAKLNEVLI